MEARVGFSGCRGSGSFRELGLGVGGFVFGLHMGVVWGFRVLGT